MKTQIGPQAQPCNRVRALALASELAREYSKQEWREAYQNAMANWLAQGNTPERMAPGTRGERKPRFEYRED
jgi:hypothetical protein